MSREYDYEEDRRRQRIAESESYLRNRGFRSIGYGCWENPNNPWASDKWIDADGNINSEM